MHGWMARRKLMFFKRGIAAHLQTAKSKCAIPTLKPHLNQARTRSIMVWGCFAAL
uniref:Uncharacterized protein n=1 Tax=Anguilla anguilla TaxID=7936 RepID=A0A0E9RMQ4_ANGAN